MGCTSASIRQLHFAVAGPAFRFYDKTKCPVSYIAQDDTGILKAMPPKSIKPATLSGRHAGRPRSESSRVAILETAYAFLRCKPIAEINTIHIARKARVSTATVYRWWPTKEALLLEAFLHKSEREVVVPEYGRPLDRLREYVLEIGRYFTGEDGIIVARLLGAIQDNPLLRREFAAHILSPRRKESRALVRAAIRAGQLPAGTHADLLLEMVVGPLIVRLLFRHEKITERYIREAYKLGIASVTGGKSR